MQAKFHPTNLIESESELVRYVLLASNEDATCNNPNRVYYDYSQQNEGGHDIDNPVGRLQTELLVRSAHRAIDDASTRDDPQGAWDEIYRSCNELWYSRIFYDYSRDDTVYRMSSISHLRYMWTLKFPFRSTHPSGPDQHLTMQDI